MEMWHVRFGSSRCVTQMSPDPPNISEEAVVNCNTNASSTSSTVLNEEQDPGIPNVLQVSIYSHKSFLMSFQPHKNSENIDPDIPVKRQAPFPTPSPKKYKFDPELTIRQSPKRIILSDTDEDNNEEDACSTIVETTTPNSNDILPLIKITETTVLIPTLKDKFIKITAPLMDIQQNIATCKACGDKVPFNQKAIFPHIRNCANIHCFRKWMFNFDAVKYQIGYAKDESWQSRWNNTKILIKNLEFQGLLEYLNLHFHFINEDYECRHCKHLCCHLEDVKMNIIHLTLISHLLACHKVSIYRQFEIVQHMYYMSIHRPIIKIDEKIQKKSRPIMPMPMLLSKEMSELDLKRQVQRIELLKLQIENKKSDLEMYKAHHKCQNAKLELETLKVQQEIKLKVIEFLSKYDPDALRQMLHE